MPRLEEQSRTEEHHPETKIVRLELLEPSPIQTAKSRIRARYLMTQQLPDVFCPIRRHEFRQVIHRRVLKKVQKKTLQLLTPPEARRFLDEADRVHDPRFAVDLHRDYGWCVMALRGRNRVLRLSGVP